MKTLISKLNLTQEESDFLGKTLENSSFEYVEDLLSAIDCYLSNKLNQLCNNPPEITPVLLEETKNMVAAYDKIFDDLKKLKAQQESFREELIDLISNSIEKHRNDFE